LRKIRVLYLCLCSSNTNFETLQHGGASAPDSAW
jgi:hypothetical protein